MRTDWTDLPGELRDAIMAHTGEVARAIPAPSGNHADVASTLETASGRVFIKGARKVSGDDDGVEVRCLRYESTVIPHVGEFAPPPPLGRGERGVVRPRARTRSGTSR